MSTFGTGLVAAAQLRQRILERLGAEPEWTEGDHDTAEMRWTSGPVTTFFTVEPGAEATPDLGVLRVRSYGGTALRLTATIPGLELRHSGGDQTAAPTYSAPGGPAWLD